MTRHVPTSPSCHAGTRTSLLKRTDIVIAATTASEPVLPDDPARLEGKHFISVGSYRKNMQEFPDSVYRLAGELAIDSEGARDEVGDVVNIVRKGILRSSDVFAIAELVAGRRSVDVRRTTAYKTAGNALFDLFVAEAMFAAATLRGAGRKWRSEARSYCGGERCSASAAAFSRRIVSTTVPMAKPIRPMSAAIRNTRPPARW